MKRKGFSIIFLSLIITALSLFPALGQNPFIPKYDAVKRSERCFTVTWELNNQFGAVWWADKVDFSKDTLFNFVVYMGDRDGNGADGLAFVMHQDPRDTITDASQTVVIGGAGTWDLEAATGDDGGGLGFAMHESRVDPNTIPGPHGPGDDPENHKIQKSVAVEMDTWNNNDVPDGNNGTDGNGVYQPASPFFGWDHTAVIYNGDLYGGQQVITDAMGISDRILPLKPAYAFGGGNNPDGSAHHNIEDDRCYLFQIRWVVNADGTQSIQLWADVYNGTTDTDGLQLIMTHTDDMIGNVFGGDPVMRFGFTGSTGGAINEQTICLLGENLKPFAQDDYASIPMNTTTVVDVEANDNDPDGDQLHVPVIIEPARYGTATIFDSLDVNYMRYTPNTNYVGLDTIGYVTCDVNSIKCYAKCDTAFVYIDVGCVPFDITVNALSPNTLCDDTLPQNGSAEASVTAGNQFGILWSEDFSGIADGTTSTGKWTMDESNANYDQGRDHAEVRNNRISISDIGNHGAGNYVTWSSEVIDISSVSDVSVTVDIEASGNMESGSNRDYINVYYKIDGGPETPLSNGTHTGGNFTAKASVSGLNGSTLQIVVRATNSANNEYYYFDNVIVQAVGAGTANMSYNWYRGTDTSGTADFVGQIYNNMHSGLYTVVGMDLNTGCLSNPQTVTIDSAGTRPVGGYIIQAAPFTSCELPYDGQLEAGVFNGTDSTHVGYLFQWYIQEEPTDIIQTGYVASGLRAREYTVRITDLSTGCDTTLSAEVPNAVSIPTVTATKIADITSCTDPNSGIGEAHVGGVTSGYRFEWYAGPAIGAGPPDFIGPTVNTFHAGNFTVQAIDTATSCPSDPATINIADLTALPIIQVTVDSEQISCDTLTPTGQLSGAVDESGVPTTAGYTFNWYQGPNDLPSNLIATGNTAGGLEAGPYRLVVTEDGTNCTSFLDTLIQDMTITPPDISVSSTNVTSCAAPNGSITITVVGNPSDYSYDIYTGSGVVQDSLLTTSASNNIQNLGKGNYTVVARDLVTKCASNPAFTTINDATVPPDASIVSVDQTSCDPGNPTGQLTANMGFGAPSDYTFNWYEDNLSGTPIAPSNVDGNIISNLDSGNYALRITNNTTQCINDYYPSVNIAITLPVESVSSDPSTHCGASANGALHGLGDGSKTGYTFIWYSIDHADTLASNSADVTDVEPGDYVLTVINNTTACASNPAPVKVDDNSIIPDPALTVIDNSSCDVNNPNGEIRVTSINNEGDPFPNDYDFKWYKGSSSGSQLISPDVAFPLNPDSSRIAGLDAGTVALVITNTRTSCSNEVLSEIKNINIKPIIDDVNPDPAENCVEPFNSGAAVVSVDGGLPIPAGYSFEWTNLDSGTVIPANGSSITDVDLTDQILPPGNYQVIAYNEYNCPSDPVTFEIEDHAVPPVFSLTAYNNISCNPAFPAGSLVASRPAGSSYSISQYEWYLNALAPGNEVSAPTNHPDSILHDLGAGNYVVRITDAATGCTGTEFATIQDLQDNRPLIDTTYIKDLTSCTSPDGELGLEVAPLEQLPPLNLANRTYTFYTVNGSTLSDTTAAGVLKATTVPGGPAPADSEVLFSSLGSGDWTSIVVDNYTHCVSTPLTVGINQAPSVTITLTEVIQPSGCNAAIGNGELKFEASSPLNANPGGMGYTFGWAHWGDDFTSPPVADPGTIVSTDGFSQKRTDLYYGYYVVSVVDIQSGCTAADTAFLPIISAPPIVDASPVDATECKPGNGQILVEATQGAGGSVATDYELLLYRGSVIDPGNELRPADVLPAYDAQYRYGQAPADFVINLPPGTYTVASRERFTADKCLSEPRQVRIGLIDTTPLIDTTNVADMTCNTVGTGELNATANGGTAGFNFQWYDGTDTTGVAFPAGESIAGLLAGNYTIKVEDTDGAGRGCRYKKTFSLPKVLEERIIIPDVTDNSNCNPYNGIIEIVDIEENGTGTGPLPDYQNFTLYNSDFDVVSTNNTAVPWSALAPGNYFINAEHIATSCITQTKNVKIDDHSKDPIIRIDLNTLDYACDPALADGELEAFVNEGGGVFNQNPADYDFNWYKGDTSSANFMYNNPLASNLYANASTQLYTVEVEDKTGLYQGCKSIKAYTLVHQPTSVYILSAQINWENQTKCYPNGSIQLLDIREDDPVSGTNTTVAPFTGRYTAQLLESDLTPSPASYGTFDPVTGNFEDGSGNVKVIPAGTYYVRAKNDTTGCAYGPLTQKIIRDDSKDPIVSATLIR
ncbi:MAG: Ig-like domain-containing protein, partial [Cytophagales bacterium]|nr:Ig-like domain-containing protein [Cytophagales bacterium]